ncbi:lytic transglycosylase domain-containing protein [Clostridium paraputrificum]|uniref:lytic transglycosylase domain-containing protein n=1 Tax=Clostridium TaxID=1485 RepID=UPI003D348871
MSINGIQKPEEMLALNMMQNIMKKSFGDGMEFEMVYQSLLNSINESPTGESLSNAIQVSEGQSLEDIPLRLMNELSYYNSNINKISNVTTTSTDTKMQQIYESVNKYSEEFGVDPKLVLAVIKAESNFDPNVTSSAGAMGLMQLMPVNCKEDGVSDPFDIDQNIRGGVKQLKGHIDRYNGDIEMALMAYNAGPGTVKTRGVNSAADLYKMPKETQNYVPKVMKYFREGI